MKKTNIIKRLLIGSYDFFLIGLIHDQKSSTLSKIQGFVVVAGPLLSSLEALYLIEPWLLRCEVLTCLLIIYFYFATQYAIDKINEKSLSEVNELKKSLKKEKQDNQKLKNQIEFLNDFSNEIVLFNTAVRELTKRDTIKDLSTLLADSIYEMAISYSKDLTKKDISVSIYALKIDSQEISRLIVRSNRNQRPKEKSFTSVEDEKIALKFYTKALLNNKEDIFAFFNSKSILANFDTENDDTYIVNSYSQYFGLNIKTKNNVKFYVEIVVYNNKKLLQNEENIVSFMEEVLYPFTEAIDLERIKEI